MAVQMVKEASTWIMLSGKEKAEEQTQNSHEICETF